MAVYVSYGSGMIGLDIPKERLAGVYSPLGAEYPSVAGLEEAVKDSGIHKFCNGKRVCALLEDETRGTDMQKKYTEAMMPFLAGARHVSVIIATGTHEPLSDGNMNIALGIGKQLEENKIEHRVAINDCRESRFTYYGMTKSGTPVWFNAEADDAEVLLLPSTMKPHYFAGYSSPIKNIMPGVAGHSTIVQNHSLALEADSTFGRHPLHPDEKRRTNPIAEDMLEAAEMFLKGRYAFAIATAGSYVFAGELRKATSEGIFMVDRLMTYSVKPEKYIVVSPGSGHEGRTLYHAQRGLELTKNAVLDGGEILFIAEMAGGVAYDHETRRNFYDRLKDKNIPASREEYELYAHKAAKFYSLINRVEIHAYSALDNGYLKDIGIEPAQHPQHVINGWLEKDDGNILVFDDANRLAVYRA